MGHKTTITEEIEHGGLLRIIKRVVTPQLVEQDDYQVLLSFAVEAVRIAVKGGRKGNFGITFIVDDKKNTVKRVESFYTESVTIVEIPEWLWYTVH